MDFEGQWGRSLTGAGLVLVIALVTAFGGLTGLPIDRHEALVLGTAQNMLARDDYVVPWFNDAPRLNKPPLSYWLTAAVARLDTMDARVEPRHGRLVSVAAALAMLAVMLALAGVSYGSATACATGLLLVTSAGWYAHTHDARADMLYSALCCTALAAGTALARDARGSAWPALFMWLCLGLATLAKGPHVPLLTLLALALWLRLSSPGGEGANWRSVWRRLRLGRGLALVLIVVLPWWCLLYLALPDGALSGSQLSGTLLRPSLSGFANPDYFYRPLLLLLPWVPLAPLAWIAAWRAAPAGAPDPARLGLVLTLVLACGLSLGVQHRGIYMLPALPWMVLATARGTCVLVARAGRAGRWLLWGQLAIVLVALAVAAGHDERAVVFGWTLALWGGVLVWCAGRGRPGIAVTGTAIALALAWWRVGDAPLLWGEERFSHAVLAERVVAIADAGQPLHALQLDPAIEVYRGGRPVSRFDSAAGLDHELGRSGRHAYVIAATPHAARLLERYRRCATVEVSAGGVAIVSIADERALSRCIDGAAIFDN